MCSSDLEDVAPVRDQLRGEACGQPGRVHPVQVAEDALVAGGMGDGEGAGDGYRHGGGEEDEVRAPEVEGPVLGPVIASRDRAPPGPALRR